MAPAVFTEPDLPHLLIKALAGSNIATPFFDFSSNSTLLLQADIGSGTYMHYKVALEKMDRITDGCFSMVEGETKNASIPGQTLHEGKNTVVVYGLCLGIYTVTLQSCRDSDQQCGDSYPASTQPKIYYQQASLLGSADREKLTQYTVSKNATYGKTQEAYSMIAKWAKSNCITAPQMQTEYCKSASNIVNMGIAQYINLVQDHYQSTEATLLTHLHSFSTSTPGAKLALTSNPSCISQSELLSPSTPPAQKDPMIAETSNTNISTPNTSPSSTTSSDTHTSTDSSSSSSMNSTQLGLIISGAALAAIGSILWLKGGYEASGILNERMKLRVENLELQVKNIAEKQAFTKSEKPLGEVSAGKWTAMGAFGVALVVIGAILPIISLFTLADAGSNQEKERNLSQQLGANISTELKKRIVQEEQLLNSLVTGHLSR